MQSAIEVFKKGAEKNFLVFDEQEELCGVLEKRDIQLAVQRKDGLKEIVKHHVKPFYGAVLMGDKLKSIYERMNNPGARVLPVYSEGNLIGIVDLFGLNDYMKKKVS